MNVIRAWGDTRVADTARLIALLSSSATNDRFSTDVMSRRILLLRIRGMLRHSLSLLVAAPALMHIIFIKFYGVNLVIYDQWAFVPLFERLFTGTLSVVDVVSVYNDHRHALPRLVMLVIGMITSYNTLVEMYIGWILSCITCFVLLGMFIRIVGADKSKYWAFLPVPWIVFGLRQYENIIGGWQLVVFIMTTCAAVCIFAASRIRSIDKWFVVSAGSAIAASYSFANGLLLWPVVFVQLFLLHGRRRWQCLVAWVVVAALVLMLYFVDYHKPGSRPDSLYFVHHPVSGMAFLIASIGAPLAVDRVPAVLFGAVLLVLYVVTVGWVIRRGVAEANAAPLGMIMFATLSAMMLTVGRAALGVDQALSSRYTTISNFGVLGLYLLLVYRLTQTPRDRVNIVGVRVFLGVLLALMFLGVVESSRHAIGEGQLARGFRQEMGYYLRTYRLQPDDRFGGVYPDSRVVREGARILEKYRLNVFSESWPEPSTLAAIGSDTRIGVDAVADVPVGAERSLVVVNAAAKPTVSIIGWAVDERAGRAARGVFISVDGRLDIPAMYGRQREDVATHFGNEQYRYSGYYASFATKAIGRGRHTLTFKVITADGRGYYQPERAVVLQID